MCYKFNTAMERVTILRKILSQGENIRDFLAQIFSQYHANNPKAHEYSLTQQVVLSQLLQPVKSRPTSMELIDAKILPEKAVEEIVGKSPYLAPPEWAQVTTKPQSLQYVRLMKELFNSKRMEEIKRVILTNDSQQTQKTVQPPAHSLHVPQSPHVRPLPPKSDRHSLQRFGAASLSNLASVFSGEGYQEALKREETIQKIQS